MRTVPKWVNKIHEADKVEFSSVHTLCYSPDGTQLVVGAGEKVMVYDPRDGALVQLLQAHKGAVHAVAYCSDGKKFASGGADKNVIIWTSKMEGVLKYSHGEAIQCLAYNPMTLHLASCALSDFAFWSADVKAVQKHRLPGRITSCAWSPNGQHLAIGLASGVVSLRDKTGEETYKITREAAVWAVAFSKSTLFVTDWNDTLSFYNHTGHQLQKDRPTGITPLSISIVGELVVVGGMGGWAALTSEGVPVLNAQHEWVWSLVPAPSNSQLAVACQDGTLWCYQIVTSTVHGLYRERYAYREGMCDVIIQHLTTGNKVRIKCHDRVQKIAIYKNRLAVQLPERVVVYEQGDVEGMLYRVKEKLPQKTECSLLVATSDALLLCQDTRLVMIGRGMPRSWSVPSPIRYVKVTALYFEEVLLLGLMNGQIWKVNPLGGESALLVSSPGPVRCLDVSASRSQLAVVDEASVCRVYSLNTTEHLFTEENVSSVSFNSSCDDLLSLSGGGLLSIKAGKFPAATQPLAGSVVGFQGGRVFCLQANSMQTINVPLSHGVHQYVQQNMFNEAYAVACLGVTSLDWERLGLAALEELSFEVARKAFQRTENIVYLNLIDHLQERFDAGEKKPIIIGEILAYRGKYSEAARSFQSAGKHERALNLYVDLRMFNKAQELVSGESAAELSRRRAEWARHVVSPRAAAEMYLAAGDISTAASLIARTPYTHTLVELARKLDKGSHESLRQVAEALQSAGELSTAAELYTRLGDYKKVAQLAVAENEWSRAFELVKEHPECRRDVYLPHAHYMAAQNRFLDAQRAYHMAGETETATRVLGILIGNAVAEERFCDAGYSYYLLAEQCLENATSKHSVPQYERYSRLSRVYHAYDAVHRCIHEPFSLHQPDALLNAARYLLPLVQDEPPPGISMFCIYLCLAKQAKVLGAMSFSRQMLDKILGLQIPTKFQENVELLMVKSRAASGDDDVSVLCWRCRRQSAAVPPERCPHCRHRAVHSLSTHDVLPLVQFEPEPGISTEEALLLLEQCELPALQQETEGAQVLQINTDMEADPFLDRMDEDDTDGVVKCCRSALLKLNPASVIVVQRANMAPLMYRNMVPELPVTACPHCHHLFYMEDYEIQMVTKGQCPFCRHPTAGTISKEDGSRDGSPSTPQSPTNEDTWAV